MLRIFHKNIFAKPAPRGLCPPIYKSSPALPQSPRAPLWECPASSCLEVLPKRRDVVPAPAADPAAALSATVPRLNHSQRKAVSTRGGPWAPVRSSTARGAHGTEFFTASLQAGESCWGPSLSTISLIQQWILLTCSCHVFLEKRALSTRPNIFPAGSAGSEWGRDPDKGLSWAAYK